MQEIIASIEKMPVNGNRLELPAEQISNYPAVKKTLIKAGGKYKKCGFEFAEDANAIKTRLCGGEVIDDKKKYQFFPTPETLARKMVEMANISVFDRVLEPSAGQGAIAQILLEIAWTINTVELNPKHAQELRDQGILVTEADFLSLTSNDIGTFDKIVANPPFQNGQDMAHIQHMYSLLNDSGTLVSIANAGIKTNSFKKTQAFREWLDEVNAVVTDIPAGTFKESGTMISSVLIHIQK